MKLTPTLRIGTQSALLILPLFLGLSWASSTMSFRAIKTELLWGFEEEALALAVSTAAFLGADEVATLAAGDDERRAPLRALRQWGQLRTLAVLDAAGDPLTPLIGDEESPVTPRPQLAVEAPEPHLGDIVTRNGERFLTAFAPLAADGEQPAAWVRVETGVEDYFADLAAYRRSAWTQVAGSVGLGALAVVLLTGLIAPRLRQLVDAARGVRHGRYDAELQDSAVCEINDLVGTFRTMTSVLGESVDKARRAVVDHEQFRSWNDIADAWVRDVLPSSPLDAGDVELAAALGPGAPPDRCLHLSGVPAVDTRDAGDRPREDHPGGGSRCDRADGFIAFIGQLRGGDSDDLAVRAAGLGFYLEQHAAHRTPRQLADDLRTHFDVDRGDMLLRRRSGDPITHCRLGPGPSRAVTELPATSPRIFTTDSSEHSTRESPPAPGSESTGDRVAETVLELRGDAAAADLLADSVRLGPALRTEAILVLAPTVDTGDG
ncbi:MAG: hypothetical protein AAGF23_07020 [Acidobacteriota bacterium]